MTDTKTKKEDTPKPPEVDPEDTTWNDLIKCLEKLEKGIEGDLSSLGRSIRMLNRFRRRLTHNIWIRIVYSLVPVEHRLQFQTQLQLLIPDLQYAQTQLIAKLGGVSITEALEKIRMHPCNLSLALHAIIKDKEMLASDEIKKRQKELAIEHKKRVQKQKLGLVQNSNVFINEHKSEHKIEYKTKEPGDDENIDDENLDLKEIKISLFPERKKNRKFYPETYIFLQLMLALEMIDNGDNYKQSLVIINEMIEFSKVQNRRTCDLLSSRLYQYRILCWQRMGDLSRFRNLLFLDYQTACIQQNEPVQSVLINNILQSYIHDNLYSLAYKFIEKAEYPSNAESQHFARYHFYRGLINCIQLQYSDALYNLQQALRRAPQLTAYAFKIKCVQWLIVCQLLMGDIPDRNIFHSEGNGIELDPFLEITEAVREGQLDRYRKCLQINSELFAECGLTKVLMRLRHNVIKTGLRKINKSYSKISLKDIANKLHLSSIEDTYFIVAKAIKDGVISANINFDEKYMQSKEVVDVYTTAQPYAAFCTRVKFCLDIRNQAVKSLRYPADDEKKEEDQDFVTEEEVAEMIQKHFDRQNHDSDHEEED